MGAIAPALPWIAKGAGALFGGLMSKRAQSGAMKRSPEEQAALGGMTQAAGSLNAAGAQLGRVGGGLTQSGQQLQQGPSNYYQTLLRGSRGAMANAVAAPTAAITETYRGAERGLEKSGVRGAARDVASADLNRQRASQLAGLTTGVQAGAADRLAEMGGQQVSQGVGAMQAGGGLYGQAGGLYSGMLGAGANNRMYARNEGAQAGQQWGGLVFDLINMIPGKKSSVPIYGPGY